MATKTNPKVKTKEEKDKDKAILAGLVVAGSIIGLLALRRSAAGGENGGNGGNGGEPDEYTDLFGHVYNSLNLQPVSGVTVEVEGVASNLTDGNGQYIILGIPNGTYTVRYSHPDYEVLEL